jgi:hypothetical protein
VPHDLEQRFVRQALEIRMHLQEGNDAIVHVDSFRARGGYDLQTLPPAQRWRSR